MLLSEKERNVSELCADLGTQSQPAVSHHLALLRHGRLIEPRRSGKHNFYALTEAGRELAAGRQYGRRLSRTAAEAASDRQSRASESPFATRVAAAVGPASGRSRPSARLSTRQAFAKKASPWATSRRRPA